MTITLKPAHLVVLAFVAGAVLGVAAVLSLDNSGETEVAPATPLAHAVETATPLIPATAQPTASATLTAPTQPAFVEPLPDRTDCGAIRSSDYRSESERLWFLANCRATPVPALAATATSFLAITATQAPRSGPACTLPSGVIGTPSFDALVRVDRSYVTITGRRLCNNAFGQSDADGQRITATVQFSAVGAGPDLSCLATFSRGFAICTVPTTKIGRIGAEVPVTVSFPTGLYRTSYLSIE